MRPIRSLLFAPANRPELLQKFPRYPADAFVIDLEDGTPEAEKDSARRALPQIVASLRNQGLKKQLFIRTNSPQSKHVQADLATINEMPIDGLVVPKVESVKDLIGFKSAAHFSRRFKQAFDITPEQYRAACAAPAGSAPQGSSTG